MGKHAILILVHNNLERVNDFFEIYDHRFYFFIHIDSKSKISNERIEMVKKSNSNIVFIGSEYKVNWGGFNFLKAILLLCKKAVDYGGFDYIHSTSESNLPIKTKNEFVDFFEKNRGYQFIEHFPLETDKWYLGGLNRFNLYNLYDTFNAKTKIGNFTINKIKTAQKLIGINRDIKKRIPNLFGGSCWFSLTHDCVSYCLNYLDTHPEFLKCFKYSHCPEEALFQTVILNSPFKDQVINDHLNYIDWEFRNGNSPANLDLSDLPILLDSEKLSARKIIPGISDQLKVEILASLRDRKFAND